MTFAKWVDKCTGIYVSRFDFRRFRSGDRRRSVYDALLIVGWRGAIVWWWKIFDQACAIFQGGGPDSMGFVLRRRRLRGFVFSDRRQAEAYGAASRGEKGAELGYFIVAVQAMVRPTRSLPCPPPEL